MAAAKAEAVPDEVAITLTKEAGDEVEDAVLLPVAKAPTQKKKTTATAKKARLLELAAAKRAAPDDTAIACIAIAPTDEMHSGPTTRTRSRLRSSGAVGQITTTSKPIPDSLCDGGATAFAAVSGNKRKRGPRGSAAKADLLVAAPSAAVDTDVVVSHIVTPEPKVATGCASVSDVCSEVGTVLSVGTFDAVSA